jgi:5-(carboxyamino)imidazole ribonucleotide synthase
VFAADHALEYLVVPANQPGHIIRAAEALAVRTVSAIGGVGLFAVELFLTRDGRLLINEIAPRAHNSGHYTIEACMTSQFEQHLRAVTGRPLGSVELLRPAAMINLVGSPGYRGHAIVEGLDEVRRRANVAVHLYEKSECWPGRKMGHITALGDSSEAALRTARAAASRIRVRGSARL